MKFILLLPIYLFLFVNTATGGELFVKPPQVVIEKHTTRTSHTSDKLAILTMFYQLHNMRQQALEDNSTEQSLKFSRGKAFDYDRTIYTVLRDERREAAEVMRASGDVDGAKLGGMRNEEIKAMHRAKLKFLREWESTLSGDDLHALENFALTQRIKSSRTNWEAVGKEKPNYLLENSL